MKLLEFVFKNVIWFGFWGLVALWTIIFVYMIFVAITGILHDIKSRKPRKKRDNF